MTENTPRTSDEIASDFLNSFLQYLTSENQEVRQIVTSRIFMVGKFEALNGKKVIEVSLSDKTIYVNENGDLEDTKPDDVTPEEIFQLRTTELALRPQN